MEIWQETFLTKEEYDRYRQLKEQKHLNCFEYEEYKKLCGKAVFKNMFNPDRPMPMMDVFNKLGL